MDMKSLGAKYLQATAMASLILKLVTPLEGNKEITSSSSSNKNNICNYNNSNS